jgi:hypothetical protein
MRHVRVVGDKELERAIDKLDQRLAKNLMMRSLRAGAKVFRQEVRRRAARERPKTLRKTKTSSGPGIRVKVRATTPLANIWEAGGAKPHSIGAPGQVLSNRDDFLARGPVKHPGFRARPIWGPAFEARQDEIADLIRTSITEGIHGNTPTGGRP